MSERETGHAPDLLALRRSLHSDRLGCKPCARPQAAKIRDPNGPVSVPIVVDLICGELLLRTALRP